MNKHDGSTLDSLFEELGELEEVNAKAAKKILAVETERRMKKLGLSTTVLAQRMGTSRNQIHRILDADDAGITLKMLFRLATVLGMPLRVGFGPPTSNIGHQGRTRKRQHARSGRPGEARAVGLRQTPRPTAGAARS
jgi:antitoxin HicB